MKTPQIHIVSQRHESELRSSGQNRIFPQVEHHYQAVELKGTCGAPVRFHRSTFSDISSDYFAQETGRGFIIEGAIFAALIATALVPIVSGIQAIVSLVQTAGIF